MNPVATRISVLAASFLTFAVVEAQESPSFRIRGLAITTLADPPASSASYRSTIVAELGFGASGVCPAGKSATLGFWSVLGEQSVPVFLLVDKNRAVPSELEMSWTGQSTEFTVYRSASPINIVDAANVLLTTAECSASDSPVPEALLFYKVVPSGS